MKIMTGIKKVAMYVISLLLLFSCSISYKFEGGSIDYNLTKTIQIRDFQNQASLVYPPATQAFNRQLRDRFIEQTRLKEVKANADLEIEGEITGYDVMGTAVKEDAFASQTKLTITVRVRYINNKKPDASIDQSFSTFKEFPSTQSLESVQDALIKDIVKDLVDMIYNATLGNW